MRYLIFTFLVNIFIIQHMQGQSFCQAPAPEVVQVTEAGNSFILLTWEPVPEAVKYRISTIRAADEQLIGISETSQSQFIKQDLEAGEEYIFHVSASYCDEGDYGPPAAMAGQTSIVIVDVILQYDCDTPAESLTAARRGEEENIVGPGDKSVLTLDPNEPGCYIIRGLTLDTDPIVEFEFTLRQLPGGQVFIGNSLANPSYFDIVGIGPAFGMYQPSGSSLWAFLFQITTITKPNGEVAVTILWFEDLEIEIIYCPDCGHGNSGEDDFAELPRHDHSSLHSELPLLYPNPARDLVHWTAPADGSIEIWDVAGRQWHRQPIVEDGAQLSIDTHDWPAGNYFLRWESAEQVPQIIHFVKIE